MSRTAEALPEDAGVEMPPLEAARFYAGQLPSLQGRCKLAFAVTLLPLWVRVLFQTVKPSLLSVQAVSFLLTLQKFPLIPKAEFTPAARQFLTVGI